MEPPPMVILVDQREKQPWTFRDICTRCDCLNIQTKTSHLSAGDYTLEGCQHRVAIERKSPKDIYITLQQHFARFDREFTRMNAMEEAWIVVEAPLSRYTGGHEGDYFQALSCVWRRQHILRGMITLMVQYPRIRWQFCPTPEHAEWFAFQQLVKFHGQRQA